VREGVGEAPYNRIGRCQDTEARECRFCGEPGTVYAASDPIFLENNIIVKENHPRRVPCFQPRGGCPAAQGKAKPGNHSFGCPEMENTPGKVNPGASSLA
jgi:hypothetical protein